MTAEGVKAAVLRYAQMAFQCTIDSTYCLRLDSANATMAVYDTHAIVRRRLVIKLFQRSRE